MASDLQDVTFKVVLDVILLLLMGIPSLLLSMIAYPYKRGFFCDDESIKYPVKPDTISTGLMVGVALGLPILCMISTELFIFVRKKKTLVPNNVRVPVIYSVFGEKIKVHQFIVKLYQYVGPFLFGAITCQAGLDIIKYSLGRLRPHFLTLCAPLWSNFSCTDANNLMVFVTADVCTASDEVLKDARLSHPSGHSSFTMYGMVFLVMYTEIRVTWRGSWLLRHFLQVLFLLLSVYTCATRISDYKHHWSDVLGGAVLGLTTALLFGYFVSSLFPKKGQLRNGTMKTSESESNFASRQKAYDQAGSRDQVTVNVL